METKRYLRARLLVELPAERYRTLTAEGRAPRIGDMLVLDQAFTGPDGSAMVLAHFPELGDDLYAAEVYESELQRPIREHDVVKVTQLFSATASSAGAKVSREARALAMLRLCVTSTRRAIQRRAWLSRW
jgi:hypothetical protein